jgi:hypothetical protein
MLSLISSAATASDLFVFMFCFARRRRAFSLKVKNLVFDFLQAHAMLLSHVHWNNKCSETLNPFNQVATKAKKNRADSISSFSIRKRSATRIHMRIFRDLQCHRSSHLNDHQLTEWIFDSFFPWSGAKRIGAQIDV